MTRSIWKGPFVDGYLLKKAEAARASGRHDLIRIWSRRSTILPQFVGLTFGVYNGHKPGAGHRGDGRTQVRRVRPDAHVLWPFLRPQGKARADRRRGARRRRRGPGAGCAHELRTRSAMSKKARERSLAENEAKAVARMLRVSPQKLNLVAGLIRGKKVASALADLEFSRKRIAKDVRKCLQSAIANAENNHELDIDDLVVAEAHVGKALVIKRFSPRGRGRMGKIMKPFANLTIVVRQVEEAAAQAKA